MGDVERYRKSRANGVADELVQAVAENMLRRYSSEYEAGHLTWRDFTFDAREDITAVLQQLRSADSRDIVPASMIAPLTDIIHRLVGVESGGEQGDRS